MALEQLVFVRQVDETTLPFYRPWSGSTTETGPFAGSVKPRIVQKGARDVSIAHAFGEMSVGAATPNGEQNSAQ